MNEGRLAGRTAIVTGGGSGIGFGVARGFLREGASVTICGRTKSRLVEAINDLGSDGRVHAVPADVTHADDVARVIDETLATFGSIDILVNAAGMTMTVPSVELTEEQWDDVHAVNLKAVFRLSQAVGRHLIESGSNRGSIINIGSIASFVGIPMRLGYATTKAAVAMLTKTLAVEWGPRGVRVNAIAPGYVRTALVEDLAQRGDVDYDELIGRTPLRRLGTLDDMASAAIFLASDDSAYITGHVLVVDGGWLAYGYI